MFDKKTVIGVSGFARSGKNTLCSLLKEEALRIGKKAQVFSFASALKKDLNEFCLSKTGISSFTEDKEEKEQIRPLLIWYGNLQRRRTQGTYWVEKLKKEINLFFISGGEVALISDLRFSEFSNDEDHFIKSYPNNYIIGVRRFLNNQEISAAHESESLNIPLILSKSDFVLSWSSSTDPEVLKEHAKECLTYFREIIQKTK